MSQPQKEARKNCRSQSTDRRAQPAGLQPRAQLSFPQAPQTQKSTKKQRFSLQSIAQPQSFLDLGPHLSADDQTYPPVLHTSHPAVGKGTIAQGLHSSSPRHRSKSSGVPSFTVFNRQPSTKRSGRQKTPANKREGHHKNLSQLLVRETPKLQLIAQLTALQKQKQRLSKRSTPKTISVQVLRQPSLTHQSNSNSQARTKSPGHLKSHSQTRNTLPPQQRARGSSHRNTADVLENQLLLLLSPQDTTLATFHENGNSKKSQELLEGV